MRAAFKEWLEVSIKANVDDKELRMQARNLGEATEAPRKVDQEFKKQLDMIRLQLSVDDVGREGKTSGIVHDQMDDDRHAEVRCERRS